MKITQIPLEQAVGLPLAHDLTGNVRGMADALKRGFQREAAKQE